MPCAVRSGHGTSGWLIGWGLILLLLGATTPIRAQPVAPVITSSHELPLIAPGTDVTLTVSTVYTPLGYRWSRNGVTIPGATSAVLELRQVQAVHAGRYDVQVTVDQHTSVSGMGVMIAVVGPEPVAGDRVWAFPGLIEASSGASWGFSVEYSALALRYLGSTPPIQWYKDGVELAGRTERSLMLPNLTRGDAGSYHAVVAGHVSSPGVLRVDAVWPEFAQHPKSTWAPLGASASFATSLQPFNFTASFQWYRNDQPIAGATSMSLNLWPVTEADYGTYVLRVTNNAGSVDSLPARLDPPLLPVITQQPAPQVVAVGAPFTLSVVASGDPDILPLSYQWRKDGVTIAGATSATYAVAAAAESQAGFYAVDVDGLRGSTRSSPVSVTVGFTTPVDGVPVWLVEPKDLDVAVGGMARLESMAGGRPPYSYQWSKDGTMRAGATDSTLTIAAVTPEDAGAYTVTLTNPVGSITSRKAILTVRPGDGDGNPVAPRITRQPASVTVAPGGTAEFSIEVAGTPPISLTWLHNSRPITGMAAANTLTIANVGPGDAGSYQVHVSTPAGSVVSAVATLAIEAAPTITLQPRDVEAIEGANVVLEVGATGVPAPTYQWFRDNEPVSGASQSTLVIPAATPSAAGMYFARAVNAHGAVSSAPAAVRVRAAFPYAGTYFGRFGADGSAGEFAVIVRPDATATLIGYLGGSVGLMASFPIFINGTFDVAASLIHMFGSLSGPTAVGRRAAAGSGMSGQITGSALTGSWSAMQTTMNGERAPDDGATTGLAGYYVAGVVNSAGDTTYSVVGPDGRLLLLRTSATGATGSSGTVSMDGRFVFDQTDGTRLDGRIDPSTRSLTGTLIDAKGTSADFGGNEVSVPKTDRLINISTRGWVGVDADQLIAGFVVRGAGVKTVLIRAVGPTLEGFGVTGTIAAPQLTLEKEGVTLATAEAWSGEEAVQAAVRVGAFALPVGSTDAVMVRTLEPGPYTALVKGLGSARGVALVEVYDASENGGAAGAPRLINISTRGFVGTGNQLLIAGFAIRGDQPKTVLIRGIGPTLAQYGLGGALVDPMISVQQGDVRLRHNDGWNGDERVAAAARDVGAFALSPTSADAALLLTLLPGNYTALLSSKSGGTGRGLIEVYELSP